MIVLEPASPVPPFEQLRTQLAEQIRSGALVLGDRLPTVRRLAEDLGIAPNTVARAYRELESAGLVETRGRNGTIVAWTADAAERELQQAAAAFADRALTAGTTVAAALAAVEHALRTRASS